MLLRDLAPLHRALGEGRGGASSIRPERAPAQGWEPLVARPPPAVHAPTRSCCGSQLFSHSSGSCRSSPSRSSVIVLNALFAFAQERQAERAVEALERYLPQHATVFRDGRRSQVEARELVPGDILLLEAGDKISADARLLEEGSGGRPLDPDGRVAHRLPVVQVERPRAAARGAGPRLQRHDGDGRRRAGRRIRHRHGDPARPDRRALAAGRP